MENLNGKKTFGEVIGSLNIKLIDAYIIRKFLGTFFFCLALILTIAVVFDFAEKIDNFMEKEAPVHAIIFDYYMNFIPYFAMLFAPLFVFISVIFFTSKMAIMFAEAWRFSTWNGTISKPVRSGLKSIPRAMMRPRGYAVNTRPRAPIA